MKIEDEDSLLLQASRESTEKLAISRDISIEKQPLRNSKHRMSQPDSIPKQELTQRSGTGSGDKQCLSIGGNDTTNDTRASPKQNSRSFIIRNVQKIQSVPAASHGHHQPKVLPPVPVNGKLKQQSTGRNPNQNNSNNSFTQNFQK